MSNMIQLGQAALQQKKWGEAAEWFGKAVKGNPKDAQAIACLGQTLCWQGKRKEGLIYLRKSGQLLLKKARKGGATELALDMANQLHHWKDYPGALELLKQIVQINPDVVRAQQLLGVTYLHLNQPKLALSAARKAVQLAADQAILAIQLAVLEAANGLLPEARQRLENILQKPNLSPEEKFRAHKELARILDKLGDYGQAFKNLQASAVISPQLPAVAKQDRNFVPQKLAHSQAGFTPELLGKWSKATFPDELSAPVFLMGFMRTGTTLTQEVLGAHPEVFVADETDLLVATVQELHRLSNQQGSVPEQLDKLDWAGVLHLRRFYWERVRLLYGDQVGKRLLLDKTTMNTIELGFVNCIFPDAKLVFLMRHPRDVCLSCFMQIMQPTPSTVHLFTWKGTAEFYAQVMAWWLIVKPRLTIDYMELRYEDAIFDFEAAFREVFYFLGLRWEADVKDFYKHAAGKYIASPSFNQVAQPLYASSVERWRYYATEFADVDDILQPYIRAFGYHY